MTIKKTKQLKITSVFAAGLLTLGALALYSQTPTLTTEYIHGGGRTLAVIHTPTAYFTDTSGATTDRANYMRIQGITMGCSANSFCPTTTLTRSDMALFVIRAIYSSINGPGVTNADNFSYTSTPYFTDVSSMDSRFKYIQKMKDLGITNGCGVSTYCPTLNTTNSDMAVFSMRAREFLLTGSATTTFTYTMGSFFSDISSADTFFKFVQRAGDLGVLGTTPVSAGCATSGAFCPTQAITREQAAIYVVRGIMGDLSF